MKTASVKAEKMLPELIKSYEASQGVLRDCVAKVFPVGSVAYATTMRDMVVIASHSADPLRINTLMPGSRNVYDVYQLDVAELTPLRLQGNLPDWAKTMKRKLADLKRSFTISRRRLGIK